MPQRIDPLTITRTSRPTITADSVLGHTPPVILRPGVLTLLGQTAPLLALDVNRAPPAHKDGSYPLTLRGVEVVDIRATLNSFGNLSKALQFPGSARFTSDADLRSDGGFAVELAVFPEASTQDRQNLIEAQKPGFSLSLRKARGGYVLHGSIHLTHRPRSDARTQWVGISATTPIRPQRWQTLGLIFDGDSLVLTVNGAIVARRVFRDARQAAINNAGDDWFIGSWVDGRRNPFSGKVAGLRIWNTVPAQHLEMLQEAAKDGLGAIDSRYEDLGGSGGFLGAPVGGEVAAGTGRKRRYKNGEIWWSADTGAHEVHGSILQTFRGHLARLGFPITDELDGNKSGSKISAFENGVIVWHPSTGAHPVWGQAWLTYAANGREGGWMGLPEGAVVTSDPQHAPETRFENAFVYQQARHDTAFEVHGAILERYKALGGRSGVLGYPTSNEEAVRNAGGSIIGRVSHFVNGSIYWSPGTGAHEVHGLLEPEFRNKGGATGPLGFPTSAPKRSGDRHRQGFSGGVLARRNSWSEARIIRTLTLRLSRTTQVGSIDDGVGWFEADNSAELFGKVSIFVDGVPKVLGKRVPNGHAGTTLNFGSVPTITVNAGVDTRLEVVVDLWDWDAASGDDKLGQYKRVFSASDLWELDNTMSRVVDENMTTGSGDASKSDLKTMVSVGANVVDVDMDHFRSQGWWSFVNKGNGPLSRKLYTEAFSDVEFVDSGWGEFVHLWDTFWYEVAFKGIADGGNCFGMSAEGHRALRNVSPFLQPIHDRYGTTSNPFETNDHPLLRNQINIRQGWQLGAPCVRHMIWNVLTGDMWQPKQVFVDAMRAIDRDGGCIMSFSSLEKFKGHAIFAYGYVDRRNQPGNVYGELLCADPNTPSSSGAGHITKVIIKDNDTFHTEGVSTRSFPNGFRSTSALGGLIPTTLMFHIPWKVYSSTPRTPFWEVLGLIAAVGGLIVLAGDGETDDVKVGGSSIFQMHDGKRYMRRNAEMLALPTFELDGLQAFAAPRQLADPVELAVKGTKTGHWRQGGALGQTAMYDVRVPVKRGERDVLNLAGFDGRSPQLRLDTSVAQKAARVSYAVRDASTFRAGRRFTLDLQTAKGDSGTLQVDPHGGDLIVSPGGRATATDIEIAVDTGSGRRIGVLRNVLPGSGTEVLRIRPDDWANPRGDFTVEKLSSVGGAVLDRIRTRGERPQ